MILSPKSVTFGWILIQGLSFTKQKGRKCRLKDIKDSLLSIIVKRKENFRRKMKPYHSSAIVAKIITTNYNLRKITDILKIRRKILSRIFA